MKKVLVALSVCAAFSFAGCIDRSFELTEVSGEMTVGGEELTVPLADISTVYLRDLLKGNDVITNDDEGVFKISFSSFGDDPSKFESIAIDGVEIPAIKDLSPVLEPVRFDMAQLPESISLSDIHQIYSFEFPEIGDVVKVEPIQIKQRLELNLPDQIKSLVAMGSYELPNELAGFCPPLTSEHKGESTFSAQISILEQLEKINQIEFGDDQIPGAPFSININLNGIKEINGGGTINLTLVFPEGYDLVLPEEYEGKEGIKLKEHNILSLSDYKIGQKQENVQLLLYLHEIDYSHHTFVNGFLSVNNTINYEYDLSLSLCGGKFDLNDLPELKIEAEPIYKDVEVVINHFDVEPAKYDVAHKFENIPQEIEVNTIAFTEDSSILLQLKGLEWIKVKDSESSTGETFSPYLVVRFPSCMHFSRAELANPIAGGNVRNSDLHLGGDKDEEKDRDYILTASAESLANGVKLYIDHIDANDPSIVKDENSLSLQTQVEAEIHLESLDGHTVLASSLVPPKSPLDIEFNMSNMTFTIDKEKSDVKMNEMVLDLDIQDQLPSLSQEIEIPEMISSIESITIGKCNGNGAPVAIDFSLGTLNNSAFPVDEVDLEVAINIGNLLRPTEETRNSNLVTINDKGELLLTLKQAWKPNDAPLTAHLEFDGLENIPAIENGKLKLDQAIKIEKCWARIKDGQKVDLEAINNAAIDMKISIDDIEVREFRGGFNVSVAPEEMVVELGDLSTLGVNINELSLNPVLTLNLKENPTGIPFFANIALKTYDAEGSLLTEIIVPEIEIAGSGSSNIVISTPYNAGKYEDVSFYAIDNLSELLSNGIPAKIAVNMSVATDKNGIYTINLANAKDGYKLEYQYEVVVPLVFDGDVDLSYESKVTGLNKTFAGLANNIDGLKVGDVGLIAELATTIPFDINLSAKLINADGTSENIDAKLKIANDGIIEGWTEKDGDKPHTTTLDIGFSLGDEHSLKALENVDGIEFSFRLVKSGTDEVVALKDSQYLNGKLKLRVRDGLTIDIFDFLKQEGE